MGDPRSRSHPPRDRAYRAPFADPALERALHLRGVPAASHAGELGVADIRVPHWLLRLKKAEHQLRAAYLRSLPAPVLRRVDGPLRRLVTFGRRAAAAPFYLRQPLGR